MGRQTWFYMDIEDERAFTDFARSGSDVVLIAGTFLGPELEMFKYPYELSGRALGDSCYLWNRVISPPPKVVYVQEQGYSCVDFMESEVVEFWRSKRIAESLSMGRLYIDDRVTLSDGSVGPKRQTFVKWYEHLAGWIRSHYAKSAAFSAYIAPSAARLVQSGIQLTGHIL